MAARGEVIQVTAVPVAESVIINEDGLGIFFRIFYIGFSRYSFTYKETWYALAKAGKMLQEATT